MFRNKGFARSTGLIVILSMALLVYSVVYWMDETDIFDKVYKVDHRSDINSIEQGISNYIIDKAGQYPDSLAEKGSGVYEVCKQGMANCPEGSISLDELVSEGYLKEIPSSYISQTENLTGYKLAYDSNRALVTIQNEQFNIKNTIKSKGSYLLTNSQSISENSKYENYDIVIAKDVKLELKGKHNFASVINYGEIIVTDSLELNANSFNNSGRISGENMSQSGFDLTFVIANDFTNTGLISTASTAFQSNPLVPVNGGDINIFAKTLNLADQSLSAYSLNGDYGKLSIYYYENTGVDAKALTNNFSEIKAAKIE
jgi:hypothetical protein